MAVSSIGYRQRPGVSQEQQRAALASIYEYVMRKHRIKQAAGTSGGENDATKGSNHDRAEKTVPRG